MRHAQCMQLQEAESGCMGRGERRDVTRGQRGVCPHTEAMRARARVTRCSCVPPPGTLLNPQRRDQNGFGCCVSQRLGTPNKLSYGIYQRTPLYSGTADPFARSAIVHATAARRRRHSTLLTAAGDSSFEGAPLKGFKNLLWESIPQALFKKNRKIRKSEKFIRGISPE